MHRAKFAIQNVRSLASLAYQVQRSASGAVKARCLLNPGRVALRYYATSAAAEPFLNGSSSVYVEEMYNSWMQDPKSVHKVRNRYLISEFARVLY